MPVMNKDPENSSSEDDPQEPLEDSFSLFLSPEDSPQEPLQNSVTESQELLENSVTEEKTGGVGWLLFLFLLVAGGGGGYFYIQEKGIEIPNNLPFGLNKYLPVTAQKASEPQPATEKIKPAGPVIEEKTVSEVAETVDTQPEEQPVAEKIKPAGPVIEEKTVSEVAETVDTQPEEQPVAEKIITPPSPETHEEVPPVSDEIVAEKTEEVIAEEEVDPEPQMQISPSPHFPTKPQPTFQKNPRQETPPQRSREVQTYLNFIEDMGNKFIELIKEGWDRLLALIPQQ